MRHLRTVLLLVIVALVAGVTAVVWVSASTPRFADRHPDLNGVWNNGNTFQRGGIDRRGEAEPDSPVAESILESRRGGVYSGEIDLFAQRKGDRNFPLYKPEHWAKVRDLEYNALREDPEFSCRPYGVPRMGPPLQIIHQDQQVVFLYQGAWLGDNTFRVIPLNRQHDQDRASFQTFRGDSVGHWEGETLVVDTIGINDESWLSTRQGYFHSTELHVIERLRRTGDTITYDVTVEDPVVLLQPWVMTTRTLRLNPDPTAQLSPEDGGCRDDSGARLRRVDEHAPR